MVWEEDPDNRLESVFPALIRTPAEVQGVRLKALVDCCAQRSIVDRAFVAKCGKTGDIVAPVGPQFLLPFNDGPGVPRIGTILLTVACGNHLREHKFEVQDMREEALFGLDLLPALGIYVGNVPTQWPGERAGLDDAMRAEEAEDVLHERKEVWTLADRAAQEEVDTVIALTHELLLENRMLDPSEEACKTIPEATMVISTPEGWTSYQRQYKVAEAAFEPTCEQIKLWSVSGFTEKGDPRCEFNSAILAVGKKDLQGLKTKWRVCEDFRLINAGLTSKGFNNARMPLLPDVMARIRGFTLATSLDLTSAYHQLPIAVEDRDKTTFTWQGQRHRWKRWPFGLAPATVQFQKVMEIVLEGLDGVIVWVDDLLVFSFGTAEEHGQLVAEVLRRLNAHGLRLSVDKCHFAYKKVLLLGHYLSGSERSVDPLKARQALAWPEPRNGKDVSSFLGFTNFVREYIPMYADFAAPLDKLRKSKRFEMNAKERFGFDGLKKAINSSPVLQMPVPGLPYQVACDASQSGMGAVLFQQEEGGEARYIAFASKRLDGAQRNYPATKRELLAVIFALNEFHEYLWGNHFILYTDHQALVALHTKKRLGYTMANWLDVVLRYTFEVRHRPGVSMILPDALSRMYETLREMEEEENPDAAIVASVVMGHSLADLHDTTDEWVGAAPMVAHFNLEAEEDVAIDPQVLNEEQWLEIDETVKNPDQQMKEFVRERLGKKFISDKQQQMDILRAAHATSHNGAEFLFQAVWRAGMYWPGMKRQCVEVASRCRPCLQFNVGREGFHPVQSPSAQCVWDHVAIDCAVELPESANGFKHILIIVDVMSRFVITKPLREHSGDAIARALYEVFAIFGPPKSMQSDNGTEFINKIVKKLVAAAGVEHRTVVAWNPRANGLAERTVKLVKDLLRKKLEGVFGRWDEALPGVTMAINAKDAALSKTAPFTFFFGRARNEWVDYSAEEIRLECGEQDEAVLDQLREQEALRQALVADIVRPAVEEAARKRQEAKNERLNESRKIIDVDYPPGSLVMAKVPDRDSKLEPLWVGPFMVVRKSKRSATYVLRDLDNKVLPRSFAVSQLKFIADTRVPLTTADGSVVAQGERAVIQEIIDHRNTGPQTEYLVRWKGFGEEDDEWLTASMFDDPAFLTEYSRGLKKRARPAEKEKKEKQETRSKKRARR